MPRRAAAASLLALLLLLLLLLLLPPVAAQVDLRKTIEKLSKWPCVDQRIVFDENGVPSEGGDPNWEWKDCVQGVPAGGYDNAKWYEATRWQGSYDVFADDGVTPGRDAYAWDARQLYHAIEDPDVARITIMAPLDLGAFHAAPPPPPPPPGAEVESTTETEAPWTWPRPGVPIYRDVVIKASAMCKDETEHPEGCVVECARKSFVLIPESGRVTLHGLRLKNGGGRLGGFVFIQAGGSGHFEDVVFEGSAYQPGSGYHATQSAGAGIFLSNVNRKDGNKPHNITFVRCAFIDNVVADGDGGAAWVRSAADGWVIFDECVFRGNAATTGQGGAVFATGGKIIFGAFCSARTFSPTARRRRSIAWVPFD